MARPPYRQRRLLFVTYCRRFFLEFQETSAQLVIPIHCDHEAKNVIPQNEVSHYKIGQAAQLAAVQKRCKSFLKRDVVSDENRLRRRAR